MKGRTFIVFGIVAAAVVIVIFYTRHERNQEIKDLEAASRGSLATPTPPAGSGSAVPEKVRKIDPARRKALLDRIGAARSSRSGTAGGGKTTSTSTTSPPSLPSLPGTISKDDIRAGVRAVIPLLAECYTAAQDRLTNKTGQIVVKMHLTGEPEVGTLIETADIGGDAHFTADKDLVECLQQTMLSVELPPIAEGGTVDVTYPIAFAPE